MTREEAMEYARELLVKAAAAGDSTALAALAALAVFQPERMSSGADRTARWRARKRGVTLAVTPSVTVDVTRCDVTQRASAISLRSSSESQISSEAHASLELSSRPESEDRARRKSSPGLENRRMAWDAYAAAYQGRYGVAPVRNAKVNGQLAQLCERIPVTDVTLTVTHYVTSQNARYVAAGHSVGCLLADAEKLRTEALTRRQGTASAARRGDHEADKQERYTALIARLDAEAKAGATVVATPDNPFAEIVGMKRSLTNGGK